jgi:membrane protease YdiL (CAAX protease family)
VISIAIVLFAATQDDFVTEDIGNSLEKANAVAEYSDQRLRAAAEGDPLPDPPRILADQRDLRFAMTITLVSQAFTAGLDRFRPGRIWLIGGLVALAYFVTYLYSLAAAASGISWLEPESTVPFEVTREGPTLAITALVALVGAPLTEEMFFRGLVFSGLSRWGFWGAAAASGAMFSLVHFDPGSFLPFVGIGMLLCWVYWRRGSLWDAVTFHFLFNATSFAVMVALS